MGVTISEQESQQALQAVKAARAERDTVTALKNTVEAEENLIRVQKQKEQQESIVTGKLEYDNYRNSGRKQGDESLASDLSRIQTSRDPYVDQGCFKALDDLVLRRETSRQASQISI